MTTVDKTKIVAEIHRKSHGWSWYYYTRIERGQVVVFLSHDSPKDEELKELPQFNGAERFVRMVDGLTFV